MSNIVLADKKVYVEPSEIDGFLHLQIRQNIANLVFCLGLNVLYNFSLKFVLFFSKSLN